MSQVEIILDAEGIENQLEKLKEQYQLKLDYDSEANFDGALCCSVVGTAVKPKSVVHLHSSISLNTSVRDNRASYTT